MPKTTELSFAEMFEEVRIWYAGLTPAERSRVRVALALPGFDPAAPEGPKRKPRMWLTHADGRIEIVS